MDQYEPGENCHIPLETQPKWNVYKTLLWRLGRDTIIICTFVWGGLSIGMWKYK